MENQQITDISPADSQQAIISKLLAGVNRPRKLEPVEFLPEEMVVETQEEDSGILEIQYADDTTSQEGTSSRKLSRSARKCKWCDNFARGASNLCARHGGGRRCHCGKLARGPSNLCMKHGMSNSIWFYLLILGGGRRCTIANCGAAAVYKSDYCRSHGGGKRCVVEGCVASVYSSSETLCFKHGGGIRCAHGGCTKAPVGKTEFCIRHGGGKRCSIDGCIKGAVCEGMCVKHHQDAYKLDVKADETISQSTSPASPLRMISTGTITIKDDEPVKSEEHTEDVGSPDVLPPTL